MRKKYGTQLFLLTMVLALCAGGGVAVYFGVTLSMGLEEAAMTAALIKRLLKRG